jgi:hypothetical protein
MDEALRSEVFGMKQGKDEVGAEKEGDRETDEGLCHDAPLQSRAQNRA